MTEELTPEGADASAKRVVQKQKNLDDLVEATGRSSSELTFKAIETGASEDIDAAKRAQESGRESIEKRRDFESRVAEELAEPHVKDALMEAARREDAQRAQAAREAVERAAESQDRAA